MAEKLYQKFVSKRHGFTFDEIPTVRGSIYGGSCSTATPDQYAGILDSVFEMTDQIATSNGTELKAAMDQVLKDEGWRVLPKHRAQIMKLLES